SPVGPLLASVAGIRTAPEPAKTSSRTSVIRARNAAAGGALAAVRLFDCLRLFAVERAVDLGDLLGLGRLVPPRFLVLRRLSAEVQPESGEVAPVPAVGADLLERGQQGLALVGLLRHLLGRPDLDRAVALQPGGGRDQLPDDHVLLQAEQPVDL